MHVHLAGGWGEREAITNILAVEHPKVLISFAYRTGTGNYDELLKQPNARLILDSGAYTAFTLGHPVDIIEYAEWVTHLRDHHAVNLTIQAMTLDVIGDQDATWRNWEKLNAINVDTTPIVTYNADVKHLHRAMRHDAFALGGLVPHARWRTRLTAWLDQCFHHVTKHYEDTGHMPRVHLLGITQSWAMERYPIYSCDSTSWLKPRRFGHEMREGLKAPRWSQTTAPTNRAFRMEIRKLKMEEERATKLWKERGITWNE